MRILLGLVVAGLLAGSFASARAEEYCGFLDKNHARVRCGFTSIKDCKAGARPQEGRGLHAEPELRQAYERAEGVSSSLP